jgi:hypothetical protein
MQGAQKQHSVGSQSGELDASLAGFGQHNLAGIYSDLVDRLESGVVTDRARFVDDYVGTMVKHEEMTSLWAEPAFYRQLKESILGELLPSYDEYDRLRQKAQKRLENASWSRYCLWTIVLCLVLEIIMSEGRVLRPALLIPSVIINGLLGCVVWYIANFRALNELRRLRARWRNSMEELVQKQQISDQYERFRTYTGGDLLKAELDQLLRAYPVHEEFWRDYYRVRRADPTTEKEVKDLGISRFNSFLELHAQGTYSQEARGQRFDALFLLAHKAFILADRKNYVLNNLLPRQSQ